MEKEKSTVNSQRIGIMLKLEAIKKKLSVQGQRRVLLMSLFHFISENEVIHILMHFIETRQVGLVQESANYGNATKTERTSNKIRSNT